MKGFLVMMVVMVMASGCAVYQLPEAKAPETKVPEAKAPTAIEATVFTGQEQTYLLIAGEVIYRGNVMGRDNVKEDVVIAEITLAGGERVTIMRSVKVGNKNAPKPHDKVYVFTTPLPDKPGIPDLEKADIVSVSGKRLQ
jgi:hypothetical protein